VSVSWQGKPYSVLNVPQKLPQKNAICYPALSALLTVARIPILDEQAAIELVQVNQFLLFGSGANRDWSFSEAVLTGTVWVVKARYSGSPDDAHRLMSETMLYGLQTDSSGLATNFYIVEPEVTKGDARLETSHP
jgi:hypothetical protein